MHSKTRNPLRRKGFFNVLDYSHSIVAIAYHLRRAFSQYPVPGYSILHAGAFAVRFACGGFGGFFPESSFFMHVPCCMAVFLKLAFGRIPANLVTCNHPSFLVCVVLLFDFSRGAAGGMGSFHQCRGAALLFSTFETKCRGLSPHPKR